MWGSRGAVNFVRTHQWLQIEETLQANLFYTQVQVQFTLNEIL